VLGKLSKIEQQIDLLIEEQVCDLPFRIIVDAKFRGRKLDVKDVEESLGMVRDVSAHKVIMISNTDDADVILNVTGIHSAQEWSRAFKVTV
jgi:hypothetical protein